MNYIIHTPSAAMVKMEILDRELNKLECRETLYKKSVMMGAGSYQGLS